MQVTNFCLLGMASLAELFPKGEVSWSGKATNQNEFEFRPTVNKEQLQSMDDGQDDLPGETVGEQERRLGERCMVVVGLCHWQCHEQDATHDLKIKCVHPRQGEGRHYSQLHQLRELL